MGTPEQKARRQLYAQRLDQAWNAGSHGQWTTDAELRNYLNSIGATGNSLYNQLYSGGGYATYGPSWDPTRTFDFEHNQNIMNMGPGEEWYNPSVASNWENTNPLQANRMRGFFNWRDQNGTMIDQKYGGNALAAWLQMRAKSAHPNSPDMRWFTNDYNDGGNPQTTTPTATNPAVTSTSTSGTMPSAMSTTQPVNDTAGFTAGNDQDAWNAAREELRKRYGGGLGGLT